MTLRRTWLDVPSGPVTIALSRVVALSRPLVPIGVKKVWKRRKQKRRPTPARPPRKDRGIVKRLPEPTIVVNERGEQIYDWPAMTNAEYLVSRERRRKYVIEVSGAVQRRQDGSLKLSAQFCDFGGPVLFDRIKSLDFSINQFALRAGLSYYQVIKHRKAAAGTIPKIFDRILMFERFLADVAEALDMPPGARGPISLRDRLIKKLQIQVDALPPPPKALLERQLPLTRKVKKP